MLSTMWRSLFMLGWVSAISGCASLTPAVELPQSSSPPAHSEALTVMEGRPSSLRMNLKTEFPAQTLELWRSVDQLEPEKLQEISVTPELAANLSQGIGIIDASPRVGTATYTIVMKNEDEAQRLQLTVEWQKILPTPALRGSAIGARAVHLTWASSGDGCVVFRRDVVLNTRLGRVASLTNCDGTFIDTQVEPTGVYAYRVATRTTDAGYIRYSEPSPEVYVILPEAP